MLLLNNFNYLFIEITKASLRQFKYMNIPSLEYYRDLTTRISSDFLSSTASTTSLPTFSWLEQYSCCEFGESGDFSADCAEPLGFEASFLISKLESIVFTNSIYISSTSFSSALISESA